MRKPVLVIVLATLVVAGAAVFAVLKFGGDSAATSVTAKPGECVVVTNLSGNRGDVTGAACQSEKATFKVGKIFTDPNAGCPESVDDYTALVPSAGDVKLCLLPNFVEGGCYRPDDADVSWLKSACTGEETVKVTKVLAGTSDDTGCPQSEGMSYPEPPITYCIAAVQP